MKINLSLTPLVPDRPVIANALIRMKGEIA